MKIATIQSFSSLIMILSNKQIIKSNIAWKEREKSCVNFCKPNEESYELDKIGANFF